MKIELVYKEKSNRDATDKLQEHYYISPSWRGGLFRFVQVLGFLEFCNVFIVETLDISTGEQ